jgi:hypothetical protein
MSRATRTILFATLAAAIMAVAAPRAPATEAAGTAWKHVWLYAPLNFQVNEQVDKHIDLMKRAKAAGYTGVMLGDYKWGRMADRPDWYYTNLERVRKAADEIGIDIVAMVMPVGYSNAMLQNDPNLAEGIAVRDCPLIVRGGQAVIDAPANLLANGGFEQVKPNGKLADWDWTDPCASRDTAVRRTGEASLRLTKFRDGEAHGNARVVRKFTLSPWRQYRVDVWIKTEGLSPAKELHVRPIAGNRTLNFTNLGVKATQDWTQHSVLFNTLENAEVSIYMGLWGGREGAFWIDDVVVREVAGVNMLRRDGCPMKITSEDAAVTYEEGRDYEPWAHEKMGRDPWAGNFAAVHPEPPLVVKAGGRIADGARLKASFYHTVVIHDGQVSACLRHPDVFRYMEEEARQVQKFLRPAVWMMSHDELRVAGQCGLCRKDGETCGRALAENVKRCAAILRKLTPDTPIYVWSDMFDPHHNAHDNYYLCGSTLEGSWEGLDKEIGVVPWYFEKRAESMDFFAKRGHKQVMAGYYDHPDVAANVRGWREAAAKVAGVEGIIYTTWRNDFTRMEDFAKEALAPMTPAN